MGGCTQACNEPRPQTCEKNRYRYNSDEPNVWAKYSARAEEDSAVWLEVFAAQQCLKHSTAELDCWLVQKPGFSRFLSTVKQKCPTDQNSGNSGSLDGAGKWKQIYRVQKLWEEDFEGVGGSAQVDQCWDEISSEIS